MRLLGPVARYDLIRVARRQPLALWRAAYGLGLLAALFLLYATALPYAWFGGYVTAKDAAVFATRFFDVFTLVQFAAVVFITPALTANAVAEEKGNNTLIFLLTTHLTNREIVLGKLVTRLLQVGLLILTGLPVLAILQFMGGVEPNLVIATFVALALTAVSLGCLGLFCGVFVKKPQNAAWRAYQVLVAFLALSLLSIWYWDLPDGPRNAAKAKVQQQAYIAWQTAVARGGGWANALWTPTPDPEPTLFELTLDWFNTPNPYYARLRLADLQSTGSTLDQALVIVLRDFAIAHGGLALLLGGLAVLRLRAVASKQTAGLTHKTKAILRAASHPPVRDRPVLWKEVYCEARPRQRWLALFFSRWFFWVSFLPAWFFLVITLDTNFEALASRTLFLLRYAGTFVVGLLCLRVGLHAARSIGGERDRQTLDSLLTTQLTPAEIVRDKWWGSLLAGRWVLLWLVVHWCLGMMPFALHPLALVALVVEAVVYAMFAASLGMYCAARCRTTKRALTATLLVGLLGTTLLPWGTGKFVSLVLMVDQEVSARGPFGYRPPQPMPWPELVGAGFTPARVLYRTVRPYTLYPRYGYDDDYDPDGGEFVLAAALGLLVYGGLAFGLRRAAAERFRQTVAGPAVRRPRPGLAPKGRHTVAQGVSPG
ncbi:MAG TPA: ABC transporter permease [Gemmataceae bacterium]|jgi:ABC-type transport system involved in multi-copper enzyme maturation permease subunit